MDFTKYYVNYIAELDKISMKFRFYYLHISRMAGVLPAERWTRVMMTSPT